MNSKKETKIYFDFARHRRKFFLFSALILVLGVVFTLIFGLNAGVDFKSGTRLDMLINKQFEINDVHAIVEEVVPDVEFEEITKYGNNKEFATTTFEQVIEPAKLTEIEKKLQDKYGPQVTKQESTVDPVIANEMVNKAVIAVLIASAFIVVYIAIRFELYFGLACIGALLHDAFIPVAMFSIFRIEVDLTFVAAILTIVGYSINDTIVIFDRIRENMRTMKCDTIDSIEHMVNVSLWQTMRRSIFTVGTVFIATVILAIFGSEGIRNFSLALIFGLVSGTYSSIFIAAQTWIALKERDMKKKAKLEPTPEA